MAAARSPRSGTRSRSSRRDSAIATAGAASADDDEGRGEDEAGGGRQDADDGDRPGAGERGDRVREPDAQPAVGERVDVGDEPGDQVTGAVVGQARRGEPGQGVVGADPARREQPQGGVVPGEPLGVPEGRAAEPERLHHGRRRHQVQHRRPLRGPGDQPGGGGEQPDRAGRRRARRGRRRAPAGPGPRPGGWPPPAAGLRYAPCCCYPRGPVMRGPGSGRLRPALARRYPVDGHAGTSVRVSADPVSGGRRGQVDHLVGGGDDRRAVARPRRPRAPRRRSGGASAIDRPPRGPRPGPRSARRAAAAGAAGSSARARATRRRWPADRPAPRSPRTRSRSTSSRAASRAAAATASSGASGQPSRMLSATVPANRVGSCGSQPARTGRPGSR